MQGIARVGDYNLGSELAAAPGERAYVATHAVLPRRARVVMPEQPVAGLATRLLREACILESMSGGVPRVFECGVLPDRRPWLAVEIVSGPTLAERIANLSLTVVELVSLLREVAIVLHEAHGRGIVHANLTPRAIVRGEAGVRVVEWGCARLHDSPAVPGKVSDRIYCAPEQLAGEVVDGKVDVYALGVIAHQALSRGLPKRTAGEAGSSAVLLSLIDRMLEEDPEARPGAAEVADEALGIGQLCYLPVVEMEPELDLDDSTESDLVEDTNFDVVDVDLVDLVDLDEVAPPAPAPAPMPTPGPRKLAWTPSTPYRGSAGTGALTVGSIVPRRRGV